MATPELESDASHTLPIKVGTYFRRDMEVTDENGTAYDLSGATVLHFSIKKNPKTEDDTEEIVGKDLLTYAQPDLATGIIRIILTDADTDESMVGRYRWDVKINAPGIDGPVNLPEQPGHAVLIPRVRRTD